MLSLQQRDKDQRGFYKAASIKTKGDVCFLLLMYFSSGLIQFHGQILYLYCAFVFEYFVFPILYLYSFMLFVQSAFNYLEKCSINIS